MERRLTKRLSEGIRGRQWIMRAAGTCRTKEACRERYSSSSSSLLSLSLRCFTLVSKVLKSWHHNNVVAVCRFYQQVFQPHSKCHQLPSQISNIEAWHFSLTKMTMLSTLPQLLCRRLTFLDSTSGIFNGQTSKNCRLYARLPRSVEQPDWWYTSVKLWRILSIIVQVWRFHGNRQ
jgi:hypothetical protein